MSTPLLTQSAAESHRPSGADVWNAIVEGAITLYRARAFHEVTLELVAAEAGVDLQEVVDRFGTREDLAVATVQVWNAQRMAPLVPLAERDGAIAFLRAAVAVNAEHRSLPRLLSSMVNIAATPGHPLAGLLQRQWIQFHTLVQRAIARDIATGREVLGVPPSEAADQLVAMYEGLQLQSMVRPDMDLLTTWDSAAARLRAGWARDAGHALWEI